MRRARPIVLAMIVVAMVACGKTHTSNPPPSAGLIKTQPVSLGVRLLDPGKEPRQALRFRLTKGATSTVTMTMNLGVSLEAAGRTIPIGTLPATILTMHTDVVDVTPAQSTVDFTYEDAKVGSGGSAATTQAMEQATKQLIGIRGRMVLDDKGRMTQFGLQVPSSTNAQLKQLLDQIQQQATSLAIPFPEEPVGKGARWIAATSFDFQGIKASVAVTYTLEDLTGDVAHLGIRLDETIPGQTANIPGLPAGITANVLASSIKGGGDGMVDLKQIVPTSFEQAGSGTIAIDVTQGAQTQRLLEHLSIDIRIQSKG